MVYTIVGGGNIRALDEGWSISLLPLILKKYPREKLFRTIVGCPGDKVGRAEINRRNYS